MKDLANGMYVIVLGMISLAIVRAVYLAWLWLLS